MDGSNPAVSRRFKFHTVRPAAQTGKFFRGYVDFFLSQDLVTDDYSAVTFCMPFDDFKTHSVPKDFDTYGVPTPEYRVHQGSKPED